MEADSDLFFRSGIKYHYCHPKEQQRKGQPRTKSAVCGWQFYWYNTCMKKPLEEIDETKFPVCEACRQGYFLWLVEE